jgi:hypothetical protein
MVSTSIEDYFNAPLTEPPEGHIPNFVNPDSIAYQIYAAGGISLSLILLFAGLRIYAKVVLMHKKWTWDDCM